MRFTDISPGYAVDDIPKALKFYRDVLGLDARPTEMGVDGADVPDGMEVMMGDGRSFEIYPSPRYQPATFTVLNLATTDIEAAVDELVGKGIVFEQYDAPKTDARGIHRDARVKPVAWFRDPAGNIISLHEL